jgi:hypothetical protein
MFTNIDSILSYKNEKYKESSNKKNIEKSKTREYLNSCIIFLYDKNHKDNYSFLNELGNFDAQEFSYDISTEEKTTMKRKYSTKDIFEKINQKKK